jgi:hypothetical protein
MSTIVKQIVQAWRKERTFRSTTFLSSKDPSLTYTTTIFWGGTRNNPNITCTCPKFTFSRTCRHCEKAWAELDEFAKQHVIHHYEIAAKPWWRPSHRQD